jgi:thymidylate synthase (FAD)
LNKIEVAILHEAHDNPSGMMMFLAKLTQRGHNIKNMDDLKTLYNDCVSSTINPIAACNMAALPHGTIKRFSPITIAVVGASRRFLAQIRTQQIGITFVSASLQYSDYSGKADFVVPYELLKPDRELTKDWYLKTCNEAMRTYKDFVDDGVDNDTAGYVAPQGLRNIIILQANHQSFDYLIRLRSCSRNTDETQFIALKIWEMLYYNSKCGEDLFDLAGPDCTTGRCREGKMSCGNPMSANPVDNLKDLFPLVHTNVSL